MNGTQCRDSAGAFARPLEIPFSTDIYWPGDEDLAALLGAPPAKHRRELVARNCILCQLMALHWCDQASWMYYPRNRNVYGAIRHYSNGNLTYHTVIGAVAALEATGCIEHKISVPAPSNPWRSRLRFACPMANALPIHHMRDFQYRTYQPIRLKNIEKQLRVYQDSRATRRWRKDVRKQNEALASIGVRLNSADWLVDDRGLLRRAGAIINIYRKDLYRVFNVDWSNGGRFYGPWWQSLPSEDRRLIIIDGQATVEHDFSFLHPRLMYALADCPQSEGDPYIVPDFKRRVVKRAFNILVNAGSSQSARMAIVAALSASGDDCAHENAPKLITAITRQHPQFAQFWGTGIGLRLQRIDSDLCSRVLAEMRALGVVALPVHDSFIVQENAGSKLAEIMNACLDQVEHGLLLKGLKL